MSLFSLCLRFIVRHSTILKPNRASSAFLRANRRQVASHGTALSAGAAARHQTPWHLSRPAHLALLISPTPGPHHLHESYASFLHRAEKEAKKKASPRRARMILAAQHAFFFFFFFLQLPMRSLIMCLF